MLNARASLAEALPATGPALAGTRVTFKSARAGSSYYRMSVEIAEAVRRATDGDIMGTVDESRGSVQNVTEARARGCDCVLTTPPALVGPA